MSPDNIIILMSNLNNLLKKKFTSKLFIKLLRMPRMSLGNLFNLQCNLNSLPAKIFNLLVNFVSNLLCLRATYLFC